MQNQNESNHESVSEQRESVAPSKLSKEQLQFANVLARHLAKEFYNMKRPEVVDDCGKRKAKRPIGRES
jgi:hypothetical protein